MAEGRSVFASALTAFALGLAAVPAAGAQAVQNEVQTVPVQFRTLATDVRAYGSGWQETEPTRQPSDWDLRHDRAVKQWTAAKRRRVVGIGVMWTGLGVELAGLLTPKKETDCSSGWFCVESSRTNKALVAGGVFTAVVGNVVVASAARGGIRAGAELAVLEAERLRAEPADVPAEAAGAARSGQWQNVSGLQAGQFVAVDVVKGKGSSGWLIRGDGDGLLLHDGNKVLMFDRSTIRRVRAVRRGTEHYPTLGYAIGMSGVLGSLGAMTLMKEQRGFFEDITGKQFAGLTAVLAASTVSAVMIMRKGRGATVYDVGKPVEPRQQPSSTAGGTRVRLLAERVAQGVTLTMSGRGVGVGSTVAW